ncbi:MAG: HDOD domain-containing protein [Gammaproteobacteria bacterium]
MLQLFKRKNHSPREEMQAVLGDYELPSFPVIVLNALEKVRDEQASPTAIAEVVASDPGLTVQLLKTVNSAAYSLKHKVENIDHAVSLLGRGELETILISVGVREVLPVVEIPGFDMQRFWCTAARRAATARALADLIDPSRRSESYTAALLQDMAIPVLAQRRPDDYGPLLERWHATDNADLAELERAAFGWDHAMVAMWMCADWDFPERLIQAIGAHHGNGADGLAALPAVSLVALLRESERNPGVQALIDAAVSSHGLAPEQLDELVTASFEAAEDIARMFA